MPNKKAFHRHMNAYIAHRRRNKHSKGLFSWLTFGRKKPAEQVDPEYVQKVITESKFSADDEFVDKIKVKKMVDDLKETVTVKEEVSAAPIKAEEIRPMVTEIKQPVAEVKQQAAEVNQEDDEDIPEEVKQTMNEQKNQGFFQKLAGFFSFGKKQDLQEEYEEANELIEEHSAESSGATQIVINDATVLEDLKKSLKISFELMQKLPKHQFESYKDSENFKEYKKLLDKHKIKQL